MLQSAIYDARADATPSQREAAREHRKRMERIHGAAKVKPVSTFVPPPPVVEQVLPPIPNQLMAQACSLIEGKKAAVVGEVTRIQRAVLAFFPDVTMNDLKSNRRTALVVKPRQLGMYMAKALTSRSLPDIGRRFGGRDHTTVLYAVRKYELLVERDQGIADLVEKIKAVFAKDSSDE